MRNPLVLIAFVAVGCATNLDFIATRNPPQPPRARAAADVEVYMTGRPARPYVELGMIESQSSGLLGSDDPATLVGDMREYAGKLGCDALVIFDSNDRVVGGGKDMTVSTQKGYRGSCLMFVSQQDVAARPGHMLPTAAVSCIPNATLSCYGPSGCRGGQRCNPDGHSYTVCDCGGRAPAAANTAGAWMPDGSH